MLGIGDARSVQPSRLCDRRGEAAEDAGMSLAITRSCESDTRSCPAHGDRPNAPDHVLVTATGRARRTAVLDITLAAMLGQIDFLGGNGFWIWLGRWRRRRLHREFVSPRCRKGKPGYLVHSCRPHGRHAAELAELAPASGLNPDLSRHPLGLLGWRRVLHHQDIGFVLPAWRPGNHHHARDVLERARPPR